MHQPSTPNCNWGHYPSIWNRRQLLMTTGGGFLGLAMQYLLGKEGLLAEDTPPSKPRANLNPLAPKPPHHPAKAKAVIFIFCYGGPSQVDLFDPKPTLDEWHGKPIPVFKKEDAFFPDTKPTAYRSPYRFKKHGAAGIDISEKFPELAKHADELCVIRSLHCESNNHAPALFQMNTGFLLPGRPSMGAWVTYGLGSMSESLPACVVMWDHRGGPIGGAQNWGSGFLPAAYQATPLRSQGDPILDLHPPKEISPEQQKARLNLLKKLNEMHLEQNPGESELLARINSYELAYRMQMAAPEVVDLSREPEAIKQMYGIDEGITDYFGRQCLMARRLVERGVRFIQLYSGGGHQQQSWDAHFGIQENHDLHCAETDKPIAGLLADLKQRGLLDSTLIIWGGEFGRMPTNQGSVGRDHNPRGFTMWLAGGGAKRGTIYGGTDEFGYVAVERPMSVPDLHATCLHLMGLDHLKLTFHHMGRDMRLTDVSGAIIQELIQ